MAKMLEKCYTRIVYGTMFDFNLCQIYCAKHTSYCKTASS